MALSAERKARMLADFKAANQPTMYAGGSRSFDETGGQAPAAGGVDALRSQILQQWGGGGGWDNPDVDLAGDLARRLYASGVTDLSKLQFTPTKRRVQRGAEYMSESEYRPAEFADLDGFDLTYDGKALGSHGFLGDINRDGSLGEGNVHSSNTYHPNLLAWSSRGKGAHEYQVEFDAQGNPVVKPVFKSSSYWDSDLGGLTKAAAMSVGAYFGAGALNGATAPGASTLAPAGATGVEFGAITPEMLAGAGTPIQGGGLVGGAGGVTAGAAGGGMTLAEQAAFLEANAGALAPGGEIAAGYGTTWGVGADGIIGQGATMTAGGASLNPGAPSSTTNPSTPSTPNAPKSSSTPSTPPGAKDLAKTWTTGDTLKLANGLVSSAALADGGGGGGFGDGEVDPAVTDAYTRAMDTQGDIIDRILGNADAILPFQQEALQFGLDSSREAYGDFREDRAYAVGRRNLLTQQQDRMVSDAATFNTEARREELAGKAIADVNQAWSGALDTARRNMTRAGRTMDDGSWKGTMRQMVADKVLAQAKSANDARTQARAEGYALTDRAAGALSYAPGAATQATAGGAGAGGSGVALTGQTGQSMNNMITPAGQLAGNWAGNATSMFNAQKNKGVGSDNTASNLALAGTLLGAGAKAWNVWGS